MVTTLIKDHKIILEQLGKVIDRANKANDEGTADLIGAYIRDLEKNTWMLSAWSKDTKEVLDTSFVG
jgi:starvation-inducible DNA-binding protein